MTSVPTSRIALALLGLSVLEASTDGNPHHLQPWGADHDQQNNVIRRATDLALSILASRLLGGEVEYLHLRELDDVQLRAAVNRRVEANADRDAAVEVILYTFQRRGRVSSEQTRAFLQLCARSTLGTHVVDYLRVERTWLLEHLRPLD